ncbi:MAG: hypothetical protein RBU26_12120 [Sphaerochaeta sp.]|jgi:hypothetical protein|nr:hypothetical protein [Sphaerochaeta sp.]MDX9825674.1 hypothetical protein [Sphaerochaeta sp.]
MVIYAFLDRWRVPYTSVPNLPQVGLERGVEAFLLAIFSFVI